MKASDSFEKVHQRMGRGAMLVARHAGSFLRHATARKVWNLMRVHADMARQREVVRGLPYEIILDVTNRCNLRCPLCVTGQRLNQRPAGKMAFGDFQRVIDELGPYLFKVRLHSWGEPFLHERLCDMLKTVTEANIGSEVSTNLCAFREEQAEAVVASGLELLIVSLDGATGPVYSQYRIGGDFQRVIRNVRALVREKKRQKARTPLIEIQFLLTKYNLHEAPAIRKLARELGADRCRTFPVAVNVRDKAQRDEWLPEDPRHSRYHPRTLEDKFFSVQRACPWLWRSAVINWDGTVSPCCVYEGPKTEMGSHVFAQGFRAVWNGPAYQAARAVFRGGERRKRGAEGFNICEHCRGRPRALNPAQKGLW